MGLSPEPPTTLDLGLAAELGAAVAAGELALYYQPEVDLASGELVGMEGLLRWQHPRRGVLPAAAFLPLAEHSDLLPTIARWALHACADEAARWQRLSGVAAVQPVWLNVAGVQLSEPGFAAEVIDVVRDRGLPPGAFGVEVTEKDLAGEGGAAVGVLAELRRAGVALAVDDFGTWHSSLATVAELPVDAVKLDRTFFHGLGDDLDDDSIVASMIRLAHARDLYVVAEGVESWTETARLCELGCDRAFGYLFSPPERPERARDLIARGRGWRRPSAVAGSGAGPA